MIVTEDKHGTQVASVASILLMFKLPEARTCSVVTPTMAVAVRLVTPAVKVTSAVMVQLPDLSQAVS